MKKIAPIYWLYAALPIILLLGILCMDWGHNWDDDFALYLEQSQAILEGNLWHLFEQNKYAMDNSGDTTGPYLYPNGFPLLLTPVLAFWGMNWWAIKIYCFLFFVASLPFLFSIFSTHFFSDKKTALLATFLIGFNYHFIRFGDWIYSDLPFFFFCVFSIWFCLQKQSRIWQYVALGFCLFFTYSIRDIGIVLLPFLFAIQYQKKELKNWQSYLPYFVFLVGIILTKTMLPNGGENHLALLQNISFHSIGINIDLYYKLIGNYFFIYSPLPSFLQYILSAIFLVIFLLGIARDKAYFSWLIFIGFYLVIALLWPSFQGMRIVFPLLPFLVIFVLKGLQYLLKEKTLYALYFLLLISLAQTAITCWHYQHKNTNQVATKEMQSIYNFIKKELPKDAIITYQKPRTLRLFTKRNCIQIQTKKSHYNLVKGKPKKTAKILLRTPNHTLIEL